MKKSIQLLLGVLLLAGCAGQPTGATVPADEAAAIASTSGTDLEWTWSTAAMVPAREAIVVVEAEEEPVVVEAVIEPVHWSALGFKTGGEVVEVLVEEEDTVAAGDLLIRLDPTHAQLAVEQAEAAVEITQARLVVLQAGPRPGEIAAAEAQLKAAEATLEQAMAQRDRLMAGATAAEIAAAEAQVASALAEQKIAYDRHEDMMKCFKITFPIGAKWKICPTLGPLEEQTRYGLEAANEGLAAAQAQLDQALAGADANQIRAAQARVASAAAERDAAQAQLDLVLAGATAEEIAVAKAGVAEAEAAVKAARAALTHTEVHAPFAGTVTAVTVEVGNIVGPGQVACVLAVPEQMQARTTDLTELDVGQAVEGRSVTVMVDAVPGQKFTGVLRQAALQAEDFRGQVVYPVTVELTDIADVPLRWGMSAWVDFVRP
jgi:multidrug efflux pump subunit AcrA (membrane-fusion protein)